MLLNDAPHGRREGRMLLPWQQQEFLLAVWIGSVFLVGWKRHAEIFLPLVEQEGWWE
jgi:hypothetical protein